MVIGGLMLVQISKREGINYLPFSNKEGQIVMT